MSKLHVYNCFVSSTEGNYVMYQNCINQYFYHWCLEFDSGFCIWHPTIVYCKTLSSTDRISTGTSSPTKIMFLKNSLQSNICKNKLLYFKKELQYVDHLDVFLMEIWTLQDPRSHRLGLIPCYYIMTCAKETFNCKIIKTSLDISLYIFSSFETPPLVYQVSIHGKKFLLLN